MSGRSSDARPYGRRRGLPSCLRHASDPPRDDPSGAGNCAEIVDLWQRRLRTRVVRASRLIYDDDLLPGVSGPACRRRLIVNLTGDAVLRGERRARTLRPGDFVVGTWRETSRMRHEGHEHGLLAIDWQDDLFVDVPDGNGRLGGTDLHRLNALAGELARCWSDPRGLRAALAHLEKLLCAAGLSLRPAPEPARGEHTPRALSALASALCEASNRLDTSPMLVDLEAKIGRSRRQVARYFRAMRDGYGFEGGSWREVLDTWRLQSGVALMTHPTARTSTVARAVGYGSSAAFCHACDRAGLPSPGDIRRHLLRAS